MTTLQQRRTSTAIPSDALYWRDHAATGDENNNDNNADDSDDDNNIDDTQKQQH
jgi:hypothetical protein